MTETLQEGASTLVYRALREQDGRPVILKLPRAEPPALRELERLKSEYEIGKKVGGPAAVRPYSLERSRDRLVLVLEDFGGHCLSRFLGAPMEPGRFLELAIRITQALAEVHRHGVAHRDLKPQNILVHPGTGEVKLTDFGSASLLPREYQGMSNPRLLEGTLPYLSPEQTGRMNRAVDYRSDLYSLGVTFFEMLTGTLPFQASDALGWVHCHIARPPPSPSDILPAVPEALSRVVLKLLSKMAEERYQSALGLKSDLERCLEQWKAHGSIVSFPLGAHDVSERFQIPQKLYGRQEEVATLMGAFERVVSSGAPELLLVSGYSGIGKSSLVRELHRPIVRERGLFLSGKFDQFKRDTPYATLSQAFHELVQQLLTEDEEQISGWKRRILGAVGLNGQLIIDVVPQMELIIGKQPPPQELPPLEAQHRFHRVFQQFMGVFTREDHPLALFLDDLQWADAASLRLLQYLITHPETRHLLVIGAYRDNEVSPSHPLMLTLSNIRQAGAVVNELVLSPLSVEHLNLLVADTLHQEPRQTWPLARLIHEKTQGNPFFATQFLTMIYQEGLVEFDRTAAAWRWDITHIQAKSYTDNVVALLVERLKRLPVSTRNVLMLAASVGERIEAWLLAVIRDKPEEEIHQEMWEAVREGLMLRTGNSYRFLHDRVQQAAYSLIPDNERSEVHLRSGRLLLAHLSPAEVEERVFDVADQLNLGASAIVSPEEKERMAGLNLLAGRKAKASTAYRSAVNYLSAGVTLLTGSCWEDQYTLAYALHEELAECQFFSGGTEEAEHLFNRVIERARTRVDKAAAYRVLIELHVTKSENKRAVDVALECLELLGIRMSPHPSWNEVEVEYEKVWASLGDRRIEELIDLPLMTNLEIQAAMRVLSALVVPAFNTDSNLYHHLFCHMVNLSLRHGTTDTTPHGYVLFGLILGPSFHRYQDAYRFGRLACELVEKHHFLAVKALVHIPMAHIACWSRPLPEALDHFKTAFQVGIETGHIAHSCYACHHIVMNLLVQGVPLSEVYRESELRLDYVRKARFQDICDTIVSIQCFIRNMRGLTRTFSTFTDERFCQEEFEARLTGNRMTMMVCRYYILKLRARFMSGDYEEALAAASRARELLWASRGMLDIHAYHFYAALTLAACHDKVPPDERASHLETLATHQRQLQEWAESCPETFFNISALVSAEIARLLGRDPEAMRLYEEAIRSARENGIVQNEGLAYELAARFYLQRGYEDFAHTYFRRARACYERWGADGKVRQLDERYPDLVERPVSPVSATIMARPEQLDLLSVMKASQAISGEIVLVRLLETLMRVLLEQAGAQTGLLMLRRGEELSTSAEAWLERGEVVVRLFPPTASARAPPQALINYVKRTRERVILGDSSAPGLSGLDDPAASSRSALCLPILRQGEMVALLYLENDLTRNAFSADRVATLELLASQAAISLENARLYSELHAKGQLLQSIVSSMGEGVTVADENGRLVLFNPAAEQIVGIGVTDAPPGRWSERYGIYLHDQVTPYPSEELPLARAIRGEAVDRQELFMRHPARPAGAWLLVTARPLKDNLGALRGGVAVISDVTDIKEAEESLRRSQRQLQSIIDNTPALVSIKDSQGRFLLVNRRFERLFGVTAEQLIGKSDEEVFPKELADEFRAHDLEVLEAGRPLEWEEVMPHEDGPHTYLSIKFPLENAAEASYALCGVSTDITERKRMEVAERFLAEASRELGTSLDYETTFQRIAELAVPELADLCIVFALHESGQHHPVAVADVLPARAGRVREFLQSHPLDASTSTGPHRVICTGQPETSPGMPGLLGQPLPEAARWNALRDLEGKPSICVPLWARGRCLGVLSLLSTQSRRGYGPAELALTEELGRRAAFAIDNALLYRKAQESIRVRDEFLSIASHELKTPLTSMKLRARQMELALARQPLGPQLGGKVSNMLETFSDQIQRLTQLIEQLLDVSRINTGRLELYPEEVDLAALARAVADRLAEQFERAGCILTLELESPVIGEWDRLRLEQVVMNLLTNALKYGARRPIRMKVWSEGEKALLRVDDRGMGIPKEDQTRIFERFERAASHNYGGLGLGLFISRQIVQAHTGRIWVESEPGKGTAFFVELPRSASQRQQAPLPKTAWDASMRK
ncbi:AAA family ATPase [Vitiosangium sp. GDMCC 1.1324]|uniref:AAA family ATPase n=1 Tax=Vitiosangium sp. (strain GDMCC 1.1324) TaxID=2138576 RepID=UPI00130EB506|nr:AAA family ATPase [Vitiosangium sp. GDMCC 1.1324]